jgi:multiple sugar transport system substrate-binding protein
MRHTDRRTFLKGASALGAAGASGLLSFAEAWALEAPWKPESNAHLSMLRWKHFVQAEDNAFVQLLDSFTQVTGVRVEVTRESFEDVQPKASVAANTGAGPDLFWGLYSLPHLFPSRCVDVTDVADYLDRKYGGWVPSAQVYGRSGSRWIAIPVCVNGGAMNYRISALAKAGFSRFPETTDDFLEMAKATKRNNTPGGLALGHASGDGNGWAHWCLWAFGGSLVDRNDRVVINSPETEQALLYAKQLYENMVSGVASWNDASNNKAFLAGEISWTGNGISIYVAAQSDPTKREIAEDMNHAYWPVGPVGRPTELHLVLPMLAMNYTRYPNACKALIAYLLEADQFNKWLMASGGYLTHCLNAYDSNPVWTTDPRRVPFRDVAKRTLTVGHPGSVGERAAAAIADFLVVDMFANVCTGRDDPQNAMRNIERQAQRIYRS